MKLIIGLGNPGAAYAGSRHNIGFSVIKALAKNYKISLKKEKALAALSGKGIMRGSEVALALPLTFMNLSGIAAEGLLKKYRLDPDDLLVVCDDMDLGFGRLKVRPGGSCAGHRGLISVTEKIGSQDFARLRIGIGRPAPDTDASEHVLSGFTRSERSSLKGVIENACACCGVWVEEGMRKSMNMFNQRAKEQ